MLHYCAYLSKYVISIYVFRAFPHLARTTDENEPFRVTLGYYSFSCFLLINEQRHLSDKLIKQTN